MQKRILVVLLLLVSVLCLFGFDWPPEPYEMPRTVLTPDLVSGSFEGLRLSIGAIGNTGLIILGILIPLSILGSFLDQIIFRPLRIQQGVQRNQFRREVKAADRKKNMQFIVDDRVAEMEINHAARKKFRELHPSADLEERIYQKQLNYVAYWKFHDSFDEEKVKGLFTDEK